MRTCGIGAVGGLMGGSSIVVVVVVVGGVAVLSADVFHNNGIAEIAAVLIVEYCSCGGKRHLHVVGSSLFSVSYCEIYRVERAVGDDTVVFR